MAGLANTRGAVRLGLVLVLAWTASARPQVDVQFPGGSVNVRKGPGGTKVDVQHPAGSVNVNKGLVGGTSVDVQHPAGSVNVGGATAKASSSANAGNDLLAVLRALLGLNGVPPASNNIVEQRAVSASAVSTASASSGAGGKKDVDVNFPGGLVNVRQATTSGRKQVDVVYPGGSVNVNGKGNNVDVQFPGGFVKLDPKEPGKPRSGVVVFPFGSVRFG